jgi:integrase
LTDTFKRLARQAGLPVIRLHEARHTAGTHMYRATRDLKKVQRWMGHATAAITADLYVHDMPTPTPQPPARWPITWPMSTRVLRM